MANSILCFILLSCSAVTGLIAQTVPEYRVTPWFENKKAAVSLTFDDGLSNQFEYALPMLNEFGFKSSFFVIANSSAPWDSIRSAAGTGHETGMHGVADKNWVSAYNGSTMTPEQIETEITQAINKINLEVNTQSVLTAAWPQGGGGGSTAGDSVVRTLTRKHLAGGARNASGTGSGFDSYTHYLNSYYTAKPDRNYYFQIGAYLMQSSTSSHTIASIVDNAMQQAGWFVPIYHAIQTGGYANIITDSLRKQFESIEARKNDLWIVPFGTALKYHKQNTSHSLSATFEDNQVWKLNLTDTLSDNSLFNQALTLRIKNPGFEFDSVSQNNIRLIITEVADSIQVNAVPDAGEIIFYKKQTTSELLAVSEAPFQLFPNPAHQHLNFSLPVQSITVLNAQGQTQMLTKSNLFLKKISIESLPPGIYFVNAYTRQGKRVGGTLLVE